MVLENGYIKFFDFGTVKRINNNRTKTFIGTVSYMPQKCSQVMDILSKLIYGL